MTGGGIFLTLPTQSVVVRLVVCAIVAAATVRLLLQVGLRVPRVRVGAALLPAIGVAGTMLLSLRNLRLPALMSPGTGRAAVALSIEDRYAAVAPIAIPAILGAWLLLAVIRILLRVRRLRRMHTFGRLALRASDPEPDQADRLQAARARLGIEQPIAVAASCSGGAMVVGIRKPILVLDEGLLARLDDRELEGVLAHEQAHLRRHDNLVALLWGLACDIAVLVPGSRWVLRQLLNEREVAADAAAVSVTGRPASLASGLLKTVDPSMPSVACASLMPAGTLVRRVEVLVSDDPPPSGRRTTIEVAVVAAGLIAVVTAANGVPRLLAGTDPEGGVGVLVAAPEPARTVDEAPEAAVFMSYRTTASIEARVRTGAATHRIVDDRDEVTPARLRACVNERSRCVRAQAPTLKLLPPPDVHSDAMLDARWRAHEAFEAMGVSFYYMSSVR